MNEGEFRGTGVIVWIADGKMKYKTFGSQEAMDKEVERIKQHVPNRCIFLMAVNWDEDTIMVLNDPEPEVVN